MTQLLLLCASALVCRRRPHVGAHGEASGAKLSDLTSLLRFFFSRARSTQVSSVPKEGALAWELGSWAPGAALPHLWATRGGVAFWASAHTLGEAEGRLATDQPSGQPSTPALYPGQHNSVKRL